MVMSAMNDPRAVSEEDVEICREAPVESENVISSSFMPRQVPESSGDVYRPA